MSDTVDPALYLVSSVKSHRKLAVPVALAIGQYEKLTDEELEDHYADITAERARRRGDDSVV